MLRQPQLSARRPLVFFPYIPLRPVPTALRQARIARCAHYNYDAYITALKLAVAIISTALIIKAEDSLTSRPLNAYSINCL